MDLSDPASTFTAVAVAITSGDLDAALDLFEPDAALQASPDRVVYGRDAIRETFESLVAARGEMTNQVDRVVQCGDIALVQGSWAYSATRKDGRETRLGGRSADVLRRQPDGRWLLLIDNPVDKV
jgi:uncharacterized protein (TIGR02246 family)